MKLLFSILLLPLTAFGGLSVTPKGTVAGATTADSTLVFSPSAGNTIAAGSTGVLIFSADSAATAGNTNFPTGAASVISDNATPVANKWTIRLDRASNANANAGAELVMLTCSKLNSAMTSSNSLSIGTTVGSVTAKAYQFYQVDAASGNIALPIIAVGTAASTSTPTITTGPVVNNGDLVFGAEGIEANGISVTADADTTNGTWSTQLTATGNPGATLTAMQLVSQYKVVTAIATQTYDLGTLPGGPFDQTIGYMILTEVNEKCRRVFTNATAATSSTISPSDPLAVGSLGVLVLATDNTGTAGTTSTINSAVAGTLPGLGAGSLLNGLGTSGFDSVSNVWTERVNGMSSGGGAANGAELAIFTAPITTALTLVDNIAINYGNTTTAKAAVLWEFAATPTPTYVTGASTGSTSTGTPSIATGSSIPAGDIVIGGGAAEGSNTWIDATDATGGNWLKGGSQSQTTGLVAQSVLSQYKISTGGVITFNPTLTAADVHIGWIQIHSASTSLSNAAFFQLWP